VSKLVYVAWSCTVLSLTQLQALSSIKTSQRSFSSSITTFWCTASSRSVCNQVENISIKTQDFQNSNVIYTVWQKVIFQWAHHNQRSPSQNKYKSFLLWFFPCQKQSVTSKLFPTHGLFNLSNGFLRLTDQARTKYTRILNNKYRRMQYWFLLLTSVTFI